MYIFYIILLTLADNSPILSNGSDNGGFITYVVNYLYIDIFP